MLWNPQALYRVHKTLLFAPVQSQMNQVHTVLILYPLRAGEKRILDIVPGGTELGTQVKTGSRAGRTYSQ